MCDINISVILMRNIFNWQPIMFKNKEERWMTYISAEFICIINIDSMVRNICEEYKK